MKDYPTPIVDAEVNKTPASCGLNELATQYNNMLDVARDLERKLACAVEAVDDAIASGSYVVKLCEDNLKCGDSPNPHIKADWVGTVAHCYAAMSFVGRCVQALRDITGTDDDRANGERRVTRSKRWFAERRKNSWDRRKTPGTKADRKPK